MATVRRTNPAAFDTLRAHLKELDGITAKAGWFESSKYESGQSVAEIAAIQEFGAHITRFGSKAGDYTVVIPPRPFMRPTVARESQNWMNLLASGARAVLKGNTTAIDVMNSVASRAAGDIAKSIAQVFSPPLKPSTIAARRRRLSDKTTIGNLDKPLVDSGIMITSVTHTVDKE
jgi:hypothetical protein